VSGIPSPFIKIYKRGRDTTHPSLLLLMLVHMLVLVRKDFLDEVAIEPGHCHRRDVLSSESNSTELSMLFSPCSCRRIQSSRMNSSAAFTGW
jgi:hypothetical protein